jgi:hypothetical protein
MRQAPDHIRPLTSVPFAEAMVTSGSACCVDRP